jgi:hypothetical protein
MFCLLVLSLSCTCGHHPTSTVVARPSPNNPLAAAVSRLTEPSSWVAPCGDVACSTLAMMQTIAMRDHTTLTARHVLPAAVQLPLYLLPPPRQDIYGLATRLLHTQLLLLSPASSTQQARPRLLLAGRGAAALRNAAWRTQSPALSACMSYSTSPARITYRARHPTQMHLST